VEEQGRQKLSIAAGTRSRAGGEFAGEDGAPMEERTKKGRVPPQVVDGGRRADGLTRAHFVRNRMPVSLRGGGGELGNLKT
jgi:hypothetical protein